MRPSNLRFARVAAARSTKKVVEERNPHFERVGHRAAIEVMQHVVRQPQLSIHRKSSLPTDQTRLTPTNDESAFTESRGSRVPPAWEKCLETSPSVAILLATIARSTGHHRAPTTSANRRAGLSGPRPARARSGRAESARDPLPRPHERRVQVVLVPGEQLVGSLPRSATVTCVRASRHSSRNPSADKIGERLIHVPHELVDTQRPILSSTSSSW